MSFPFIRQYDLMDCGPTCLMMICKYYKRSFTLQALREKTGIGKEGVNLLGISEAAESIGFRTQAVKLSSTLLLNEVLRPAILYWDQNHFVVLTPSPLSLKNRLLPWLRSEPATQISIADPAKGLITYTPEEFKSHWLTEKQGNNDEGIALILEPTPQFYEHQDGRLSAAEEAEERSGFKNIFSYLFPYKKLVLQLLLGLGIASMLQLILPFLTQSVVDVGVNASNMHFIYLVLLAQLVLVIGRLSVDFVRSWILLYISSRINISILTDFLIKLMKLPIPFFDSKKTGDIMQRMDDYQRIESFLTGSSINVLFSLLNLLIFSIVLAVYNAQIFFVFIIAVVLYSSWVLLFLKKRKVLDYKRFDIASKEQSLTIQLVQGMQEIKLNGVEKPMRWDWERLQAQLFRLNMKGLALNQWQQSGAFLINEGKNILITFLSAMAVINGQMTLGAMLAVQYIIGQLNSPIEQMINFVQSWQNAKISVDRLNEIHTLEEEEPSHKQLLKELPVAFKKQLVGGKDVFTIPAYNPEENGENLLYTDFPDGLPIIFPAEIPIEKGIVFQNVSFTYPGAGNDPVLKNIDLTIPEGKTTAIVGVSGSGKTTLLKLLLKFYIPQKGEIRLNNTSLSMISHKTWRSHCSTVMQESFIFSDTIAGNIAVGAGRPDMDRLHYAATIANIQGFIESLPLGFNTRIGAEGIGISMGQKQRILIARAVYRNPDFIFLDEATNSLDANNESMIIRNLAAFLHGKTVVVVAHRLSTVTHADHIVVLKNGMIAERGTHRELVDLKGEYFTLVKNQLELGA